MTPRTATTGDEPAAAMAACRVLAGDGSGILHRTMVKSLVL